MDPPSPPPLQGLCIKSTIGGGRGYLWPQLIDR